MLKITAHFKNISYMAIFKSTTYFVQEDYGVFNVHKLYY